MVARTEVNTKIGCEQYFSDIDVAWARLMLSSAFCIPFDCIVATKRSGLMMGTHLSNKLNIPMFVTSGIPNIPAKFKQVLLVDDKIWHGRQFRKYTKKLQRAGKFVCSMCLYIEGTERPDIYVQDVGQKVKLFYER